MKHRTLLLEIIIPALGLDIAVRWMWLWRRVYFRSLGYWNWEWLFLQIGGKRDRK